VFSRKDIQTQTSNEPVTILENGDIKISACSAAEAKIAIKQLKIHKKQIDLQKKEIVSRITQIRAQHRVAAAQRGSMVRGGGTVGKVVRIFQRANRDTARLNKENAIVPLEQEKQRLDMLMRNIDSAIIKLQQYIYASSG
jgi:sorbitol-specific phosphotransferase system component IIBC